MLISYNRFPKIARQDISCFKNLERISYNKYVTPYKKFPVIISSMLIAQGSSFSLNGFDKGRGYIHAYRELYDAVSKSKIFNNWITVKCIIPKGTKYHLGKNHDICAKKMYLVCEIQVVSDQPTSITEALAICEK